MIRPSIGVQQISGDAVLSVISRGGSPSFADDFQGWAVSWRRAGYR